MRLALLLALVAARAAAEPQLNGFVTYGRGELEGTVTARDGARDRSKHPMRSAVLWTYE
jgi:hypothetical protein